MDESANLKDLLKKPIKASPLEQVKADAKYNYLSRMKEKIELERFKEAKVDGKEAVESLSHEMMTDIQHQLGYEVKPKVSSKKG